MSLTHEDLQAIRTVVQETINPLKGEVEALSNDVKEIYSMLAESQKYAGTPEQFENLSLEQKILNLHASLLEAAKQAGITLPSH